MNIDTVQINVPRSLLVAAFLEKMARAGQPRAASFAFQSAFDEVRLEPKVGAAFEGGIFAGYTLDGLTTMALVLLPGDEAKPWTEASEWAAAQGGSLPTRIDALVLWQNLPAEFKKEWYWTREEGTGNADFAWIQSFNYGDQGGTHKSLVYRCRAVRRVAI